AGRINALASLAGDCGVGARSASSGDPGSSGMASAYWGPTPKARKPSRRSAGAQSGKPERSSAVISRSTRAGTPAATTPGGTSLVTTLPEPTTAPSPIVTPGFTVTPPPSHTREPISTGRAKHAP